MSMLSQQTMITAPSDNALQRSLQSPVSPVCTIREKQCFCSPRTENSLPIKYTHPNRVNKSRTESRRGQNEWRSTRYGTALDPNLSNRWDPFASWCSHNQTIYNRKLRTPMYTSRINNKSGLFVVHFLGIRQDLLHLKDPRLRTHLWMFNTAHEPTCTTFVLTEQNKHLPAMNQIFLHGLTHTNDRNCTKAW